MKVAVIKRDKSEEKYDEDKIIKVVKAAGLKDDEAEKLAKDTSDWIKKQKYNHITSLQIRDHLIVKLQKVNEAAAKKFIWYEKYKDKYYGVNFN